MNTMQKIFSKRFNLNLHVKSKQKWNKCHHENNNSDNIGVFHKMRK